MKKFWKISVLFMVWALLLAACAPASPEMVEVEKQVVVEKPVVQTVVVEKEVPVEKEVVVTVEVPVEAAKKPLKLWASYDLTDESNPPSVTLRQAIETFEATTGIQVEYEQVAWDQIATKLAVQAQSGGAMPDVVEIGSQHVLALINAGALMDMADLVAETSWAKTLSAAESQACVIGGERFCIAADIRGGAWYYNVGDFPQGWPTTPEGWMEEGARLKGEGKHLSTFFAGRHYSAVELSWGPWFYSNGGSIFDDEGKPDWASPENVQVVEWVRELLAEGYIPETCFIGDFTAGETPWVDGSAASVRGGSWSYLFIPGLQEKIEAGETTLGLAPAFDDAKHYVFLVGEGWGIPNGAENVEGAMVWFNFFMNPQIMAQWASQHFGIPTIESAFKASAFDNEFYRMTFENLSENGIFIEPSPYYVESLTKLSETLQDLMLKPDLDAMEALQDAQDEILTRYW